jgi:Uma2 family endonuclease
MPRKDQRQASVARVTRAHTPDCLTLADVLHDLGGVAPERVRAWPPPGEATEKDLIQIQRREKRNYELVDGTLVEKIMGAPESCLTSNLDFAFRTHLATNDAGFIMLSDGPTRLRKRLVRIPDLSFISWERMPTRDYPATPIAGVVPNLAVEVLSAGNRPAEMARKRNEYFLAGVQLVWEVDPFARTVAVYTSPEAFTTLTEEDTLDGGSVLPGFTLPLSKLFARLPRDLRRRPKKKKKE